MNKVLTLTVLSAALLAAACGQKPQGGAPGGGFQMPPAEVGVVKAAAEPVGLVTELPGRLEAVRVAQVRARVAGIVQKRAFQEGSDVKAGALLYQLDPAPLKAAVDSASATLARAEANLAQAKATVERYAPLVDSNVISKLDFQNAQAAQKLAEADVAAGRAAVQTARINLGYATITAPISGRIGRTLVTEGALVGQGEATQMAVIQQVDPLYVNFTQSVAEMLALRRALDSGKLKQADGAKAAVVRVVLEDGTLYPDAGRLLFSDLSVDQTSGQVTLRAELPNKSGLLLPGLYVRVRVEQAKAEAAILLPQQAVQRAAQGDTVMVVDDKGAVAPRPVKLGTAQGNRWVVLEGLQGGEQVVVDGFQKIRPGAPVKPVPWQPGGGPAAGKPGGPGGAGGQGAPAAGGAAGGQGGPGAQAGAGAAGGAAAGAAQAAGKDGAKDGAKDGKAPSGDAPAKDAPAAGQAAPAKP